MGIINANKNAAVDGFYEKAVNNKNSKFAWKFAFLASFHFFLSNSIKSPLCQASIRTLFSEYAVNQLTR